ncbi:5-formyltetrahydrofolate cyclo-ligase [Kingella potus]|uniref:5-formyltetrahydrofolate cyclo-ligase n=1 Tax=Kingella potus TaxID=265175 RepID=UPI003140B14E
MPDAKSSAASNPSSGAAKPPPSTGLRAAKPTCARCCAPPPHAVPKSACPTLWQAADGCGLPPTPKARNRSVRAYRGTLCIPQFAGGKVRADRLDVIILPVVAADRNGCRLGQAGGYYDASLAACRFRRPLALAAGFACQLADELPREAHDILLDGFVSERHNLRFTRRR